MTRCDWWQPQRRQRSQGPGAGPGAAGANAAWPQGLPAGSRGQARAGRLRRVVVHGVAGVAVAAGSVVLHVLCTLPNFRMNISLNMTCGFVPCILPNFQINDP